MEADEKGRDAALEFAHAEASRACSASGHLAPAVVVLTSSFLLSDNVAR
jgi:hypothetical protein